MENVLNAVPSSDHKCRCLNFDWIELFCEESPSLSPCNTSYFQKCGYQVIERDYGTRQYRSMFTVCDEHGHGMFEIRREPVSGSLAQQNRGIFSEYSCHIRVVNRYCYDPGIINRLADFLYQHHYTIKRIFRLDIALDFEKFDDNTDPQKFIKRYVDGRYTKVNQGSISAHGVDRWEGRTWHSLSWGAPKSMVSTKLYCKTLELQQQKDKPYIRYAWFNAGLVNDYTRLTQKAADGSTYKPVIWRLEFSLRSSAKGWIVLQDCAGKKVQNIYVPHDLDAYDTPAKLQAAFQNLCRHYFHFKRYEEGVRKDLCKDRDLFAWSSKDYVAKLDRLITDEPASSALTSLRHRLEELRMKSTRADVASACNCLIDYLTTTLVIDSLPEYSLKESLLLQHLLKRRIECPEESFETSLEICRHLIEETTVQ